jgi:hypothetical protein
MSRTAPRASSPVALHRMERALDENGRDVTWIDEDAGHSRSLRTSDPDGHVPDVHYDTEWYEAPDELAAREEEQKLGEAWNLKTIESFHRHCTPLV